MINSTSLLAYNSIRGVIVGNKQKEVYKAIEMLGEANNKDIARLLGQEINTITPRVVELRSLGLVIWAGDAKDPRTGRKTSYWKISK